MVGALERKGEEAETIMERMVQTEDLVFEYAKRDEEGNVVGTQRAIDQVSLEVKEGQFIAILGHNGSGKSGWFFRIRIIRLSGLL